MSFSQNATSEGLPDIPADTNNVRPGIWNSEAAQQPFAINDEWGGNKL